MQYGTRRQSKVRSHMDPTARGCSAPRAPAAVGARGIAELYCDLAKRLEQIVRLDVRAPEPFIEDACQAAWTQLVAHCDRVRQETALAWLAKTAVREAIRLTHRDRREISLEETMGQVGDSSL